MDYTKVNSNDQLDLLGSCLVGCDGISTTYTYNLYMLNSVTKQWISFTNTSYYYTTGQSNMNLTILKNLFVDYPTQVIWKIEFVANVMIATNQSYQGSTSNTIFVNFSPLPGNCDILPKNGTTSTLYTIMCDSWSDPDGSIKSYAFYGKRF